MAKLAKLIDENGVARLVDNTKTLINSEVIKTVVVKAGSGLVETKEEGLAMCDSEGNVGMKYDTNGLDAAKLSTHFRSLLGNIGGSSSLVETNDEGFAVCDNEGNIGMKYDTEGLDTAKVSTHFLSLLGNIGGSSSLLKSVSVVENGLFLVDDNYNIGCYIDSTGLHVINVPEVVTM